MTIYLLSFLFGVINVVVLISWVLPALDAAYHHVSWLCLQQVGNVLSFAGRDRNLGELWNT